MIRELFENNDTYESAVVNANLLDFSQVREYGFICKDRLYIPNNLFIKPSIKQPVINFVDSNEALDKLLSHIRNHCTFGRIPTTSKFHINNIKLTKSYINSEDLYKSYMFILLSNFLDKMPQTDFTTFSEFFNKFVYEMYTDIKFMSDFMKSEIVSIFSTGLAYQIFDEKKPDMEIAKSYIQDDFFYIFKNICLQYNFIIDKHMPWIIVYRVSEEYLTDNINRYKSVYASDMSIFFSVMKILYTYYVRNILNQDLYNNVDIDNFSLSKDAILNLYIEKKLEIQYIKYTKDDFLSLKNFFKTNTLYNGLESSAHKLNNIKQVSDAVYDDWQQIYLGLGNN